MRRPGTIIQHRNLAARRIRAETRMHVRANMPTQPSLQALDIRVNTAEPDLPEPTFPVDLPTPNPR